MKDGEIIKDHNGPEYVHNPLKKTFFGENNDTIEDTNKPNSIMGDYMNLYNQNEKRANLSKKATQIQNQKKLTKTNNIKKINNVKPSNKENTEYTLLLSLYQFDRKRKSDIEILNDAIKSNDLTEINENVFHSRTFISVIGISTVAKYLIELLYNFEFIDIENSFIVGDKSKVGLIKFIALLNKEYETDIDSDEYIKNFNRIKTDISDNFCMPSSSSMKFFVAAQNYQTRLLEFDILNDKDEEEN